GLLRELLRRRQVLGALVVGIDEAQLRVRVRDRDELQELTDAALAAAVLALEVDLDARAVRLAFPVAGLVDGDRLVLRRVDADREAVRLRALARAADDAHRLAGRQLAVHAGRRDADPLLATALPQPVE